MDSGIHKERVTIILYVCMCANFDNASPYTTSKFSNNHYLYRDTMPLKLVGYLTRLVQHFRALLPISGKIGPIISLFAL